MQITKTIVTEVTRTHDYLEKGIRNKYPEKVNVWAGILGDANIGLLFIEGNLNSEMYAYMLERSIEARKVHELENQKDILGNLSLEENLLHFQQDVAPPHYVVPVRQWLDNNYANQWIGKRDPIQWPPRSPDLPPLDFFLWGNLNLLFLRRNLTQ